MKFAVIKKKTILAVVMVAITVTLCFMMLTTWSSPVSAVPLIGKTVVIDAGHGGIDGGVSGVNTGVTESEINLALSKSLAHFFERNGYEVVLTRTGDDGLYDENAKSKKLSDMQARRDVINSAKPDLVISVHQNYYPLSSVKGAQVFYNGSSEKGKEVAERIQSSLNDSLGCDRVSKSGDYYLVNCTQYLSVLVECGFLSNPTEEKLLTDASYQEKVAYAIYSASHAYLMENGESNHTHALGGQIQ